LNDNSENGKVEFSGLYAVPGEGAVVALTGSAGTLLFDKRGLQHRILTKKASGENTDGEEYALSRLNQLAHAASPDQL